ncbi:hypothetical protein TKK_0003937 [Trichogramma kaykai]
MVTIDDIKRTYPLHWLVWNNERAQLDEKLKSAEYDIEQLDNRGRTPLMLAVTLGYVECASVLLEHEANVNAENKQGWSVLKEALATGNPELVQLILARRDYQRYCNRIAFIPELLLKLKQAPDFYVEMKWEFTSWVPLASRMCPSDTYKVYKQGSNVRIDTTLLGFDHFNWQRENRSYVFKGQMQQTQCIPVAIRCKRSYVFNLNYYADDGATMMEVDHETKKVFVEQMKLIGNENVQIMEPTEEDIVNRLTNPIVTTYIDMDKISFERNKAGLWGWRSDKSEIVNGHECKVFSASNVELITKSRTEHLTEEDKIRAKSPKTPLQSFLGMADETLEEGATAISEEVTDPNSPNPYNVTPEEYFDSDVDLSNRDIGRIKEVCTKVQKFKATLWLSEDYPLSLQEQIMPIIDLMAITSSHFAKLKDFIQMQLPSGFPVKIEIPLFHILNARITFGNIFGLDQEVPHVSHIEESNRLSCILDDACFEAPAGYSKLGAEGRSQGFSNEEDQLLQFAIQQSLLDAGSEGDEVDIWEALNAQRPSRPTTPPLTSKEDLQLQRAIRESLEMYQETVGKSKKDYDADDEDEDAEELSEQELREYTVRSEQWLRQLNGNDENAAQLVQGCTAREQQRIAHELSLRQYREEEQRRQLEEETFRRVLELSLTDK